jgi:hypothetical protein
MSDPTNDLQLEVTRCYSELELTALEERYRQAWAKEPDDFSLRSVLADALLRRRRTLNLPHMGS